MLYFKMSNWYLPIVLSLALVAPVMGGEEPNILTSTKRSYEPEVLLAKIFNLDATIQSRSKNRFRFDDDNYSDTVNLYPDKDFIRPGDINQDHYPEDANRYKLAFNNGVGRIQKKLKQRVRIPYEFASEYPGQYIPGDGQAVQAHRYSGLRYPGSVDGTYISKRPSLASEALSSVTEALTSIALFDDRKCVARLLCEATSGGPLGGSSLQSVAGLEPLLMLLSAYSGISSNPLFVFGRAAFLGISSKNNPASCRYAYPLCPTDPEDLVYYLNNHNGGFFRFFNAPQPYPQDVNQFYDQLSQNFNIYQNHQSFRPNYDTNSIYSNKYESNPYAQNKYGLLNTIRFKDNKDSDEEDEIEDRIQNLPERYLDEHDDGFNTADFNNHNTRWSFPDASVVKTDNLRLGKGLKFPEYTETDDVEYVEKKRDTRGFVFPGANKEGYTEFNKYTDINPIRNDYYNNLNYYKGYKHDRYAKDQSIRTVYVVRGNGDPNHPEIIRLRPGQSVY